MATLEMQCFRGTGHVVVILLQFREDHFPFEVLNALRQGSRVGARTCLRARPRRQSEAHGFEIHLTVWRQQHQTLHHIPQLAHVTWPGVRLQYCDRLCSEGNWLPSVLRTDLGGEVLDQGWNVVAPLAQGRQSEWEHIDAMEQVLPKLSLFHLRLKIPMG